MLGTQKLNTQETKEMNAATGGRIERTLGKRFKGSKVNIISTFNNITSFSVNSNNNGFAELMDENTLFIQFSDRLSPGSGEIYSGMNKLEN